MKGHPPITDRVFDVDPAVQRTLLWPREVPRGKYNGGECTGPPAQGVVPSKLQAAQLSNGVPLAQPVRVHGHHEPPAGGRLRGVCVACVVCSVWFAAGRDDRTGSVQIGGSSVTRRDLCTTGKMRRGEASMGGGGGDSE